ncbi:YnhF family membrane protein [Ferrimonas futtsuensis]|nr:YnhF family membrane protein [Ferrimonas futtsuensis]
MSQEMKFALISSAAILGAILALGLVAITYA